MSSKSLIYKQKILLINDNKDESSIIKMALFKAMPGVRVYTAMTEGDIEKYLNNVEAGIQMAPRIVLLDLYMPTKLDGLQLLAYLRNKLVEQNRVSIPIIVFSISDQHEDVNECYQHGANAFITKPLLFDQLLRLFQVIKTYWFDTVVIPDQR